MYYKLTGTLLAKGLFPLSDSEAFVALEMGNGVTYQLMCAPDTLNQLPPEGELCQLYTRLIVREDDHILIGFVTRLERDVFNLLLTASGVGLKMALNLIGALGPEAVVSAIASGEHKPLTAAKGVGPKLAQKMVLELKDKLAKWRPPSREEVPGPVRKAKTKKGEGCAEGDDVAMATFPFQAVRETEALLFSLGYGQEEINDSLSAVKTQHSPDLWSTCQTEWLVREALGWLSRQLI